MILLLNHESLSESFLRYRRYRHLKLACVLLLVTITAYALQQPPDGGSDASWLSYALGGLSGALVLLLLWFGIHKRRYGRHGTLAGWLSAHVYFGLALMVIVTLHSGFRLGLNIHSLAWLLVMISTVSGLVGVVVYLRYPARIAAIGQAATERELVTQLDEIDRRCQALGQSLNKQAADTLAASIRETQSTPSMWAVLFDRRRSSATHDARLMVEHLQGEDDARLRKLHAMLSRKEVVLAQRHQYWKSQAWLRAWLYLHVPFSIALLVAVLSHILAVFFFW